MSAASDPRETARPKITFAGDTHRSLDHLAEVPDDHVIIHAGDFAEVDRVRPRLHV